MRFPWHRPQAAPLETRLRDLFSESTPEEQVASERRAELSPELSRDLSRNLSDDELAGLALHRISGLRELPAARLEALGRRGFARSSPRPSMVALRWSLTVLATVLALNLAVAAALAGIDRFGPRISRLLAADHAGLAAQASQPAHPAKAVASQDGLDKVGHILWVDRDPQQALAAFVAYLHDSTKASPENAVLATEASVGSWESDLTHAEGMRDASRCPEALHLFEKVLAASPESTDLRERAAYGRAQCLGQTGDAAGAKAELRRYLTSFPKGKYVGEARKALAE